ncbi:MAG: AMIN domain-containing protein, partial [Acidobacteriota bacterium]
MSAPIAGWWVAALAAAALAVQVGCSSSGQPRPQSGNTETSEAARPEGAVSTAQVRQPAEIRSLELAAKAGAEAVELTASRPLVWTSFRDAAGDLVIELPNSVPSSAVRSIDSDSGLITSVGIERIDDAARPLTRLVVKTREPSEHSLSGDGDLLRIQLATVGSVAAAALVTPPVSAPPPPPPALAYEPLPEEDLMAPSEPAVATQLGTPEAPVQGPPPSGVAASQLFSVDILESGEPTVVRIAGDGEFAYSMFRLENPERFVVDLSGVVNTAGSSTLPVASNQVDQIRIGQFKPRPDPVSRVVFDLHQATAPRIERTADGLTVTFGAPALAAAGTSAMAKPEMMAASEPPEPEPRYEVEPDVPETQMAASEPQAAVMDPLAESTGPESTSFEEPRVATSEPAVPTYEPPVEAEDIEAEPMVAGVSSPEPPPMMAEADPPPAPVYTPPPVAPAAAQRATPQPVSPQSVSPQSVASISQAVGTSDVALFEAQQVQVDVDPRLEEKEKFLASFGTLVIDKQEDQYYGELIDMSLRKADLVETLRSFATISDLNFVIQPGVGGTVTVELKGVPWDQAMHQILKINNLGMDIDGTIVRIAPTSQLRAEAEEQRRLQQIQQQSVPLRTVMRSLSY